MVRFGTLLFIARLIGPSLGFWTPPPPLGTDQAILIVMIGGPPNYPSVRINPNTHEQPYHSGAVETEWDTKV
jgi:hypothetical protein